MIFRFLEVPPERDIRQTREFANRVEILHQQKLGSGHSYVDVLVLQLCQPLHASIQETVRCALRRLIEDDGLLLPWHAPENLPSLTATEHIEIRQFLHRKERLLSRFPRAGAKIEGFLAYLVGQLFGKIQEPELSAVQIPVGYLHPDFPSFFDRLVKGLASDELRNLEIFHQEHRIVRSVIDTDRTFKWPEDCDETDPYILVDDYLPNSHFGSLCLNHVGYEPPLSSRLEHTQIVGGSGHGKSELIKSLILSDMPALLKGERSILVMDSQGDLLDSLLRLSVFHPENGKLKDKLIIIDPHELERPPALNLFALKTDSPDPLTRERQTQSAVSLYEYLFGSLLGAELTQRQGTLFSYLARLMMVIPGATIHTLRDVLEQGEQYRPFIEKLDGSPREFFETRFFAPAFAPVKTQIVNRLWGILSTGTLDRMFSGKEMAIDLGEALQTGGTVILVNTAKELLKEEASSFFGKFILSLLSHTIVERAAIPESGRLHTYVYVDEANEYVDGLLTSLFTQSRKYKVGLTVAHQNLDQLDGSLRSTLASSTSIKFAGGVSEKDARALSGDMRTTAGFIMERQKGDGYSDFALSIRNVLPKAASAIVHLGGVDELGENDEEEIACIKRVNSSKYGRLFEPRSYAPKEPPKEPHREPVSPVPAQPPKSSFQEGHGGREHKYLQSLVRKLAQERGYRAEIEKAVAGGFVDVWLSREEETIAVEIALSTDPAYEVRNLKKCLALKPSRVLVLSPDLSHLQAIQRLATQEPVDHSLIFFRAPDQLADQLPPVSVTPSTEDVKLSRGYKVKVRRETGTSAEVQERRKRVASVVAGMVVKSKT